MVVESHDHFLSLHKDPQEPQGLELSAAVELVTAVGFLLVSALGQKHLLVRRVQHETSDKLGCDVTLNH